MNRCKFYKTKIETWINKEKNNTLCDTGRVKKSTYEWCDHPESPKTKEESIGHLECKGNKDDCPI